MKHKLRTRLGKTNLSMCITSLETTSQCIYRRSRPPQRNLSIYLSLNNDFGIFFVPCVSFGIKYTTKMPRAYLTRGVVQCIIHEHHKILTRNKRGNHKQGIGVFARWAAPLYKCKSLTTSSKLYSCSGISSLCQRWTER